jgi:hypothetical protein
MFAIHIKDDDLAKAMRLLGSLAHDVKAVPYMREPKVTPKPKVNGAKPNSDSSQEMVIAELRKLGGTINPAKMKEVLTTLGYSPTSYSYFLNELAKSKLIKKTGKGRHSAYDWPKA